MFTLAICGRPNVGKSTLIARISATRPKIANYPFTTLSPNLGVVSLSDDRSLVVADVPGLIEGAHEGHGLGDRFLQHLERTRVLVHVVDVSSLTGRQPDEDLEIIRQELTRFRQETTTENAELLSDKVQLVAANKIDAVDAPERLNHLRECAARYSLEVHPISAVTGEGVGKLLEAMWKAFQQTQAPNTVNAPTPP